MKEKSSMNGQWWRITLLLLTWLFLASSPTWAITFVNGGYTAITCKPANDNGTYHAPYFEMKMLYYDNTNGAHCYWVAPPEIWVDGVRVCNATELGIYGENGGSIASSYANSNMLWWGKPYDKTEDGVTYRVRFRSPFVSQTWSGHEKYSCYMRVYISSMESNSYHEVRIKGQWMYGNVSNIDAVYEFKAPVMWGDNNTLTADMTDYQTLSLSGQLNTSYGPTTVGLNPGGEGAAPTGKSPYRPHQYVNRTDLVSAKEYAWKTSSYSNQSCSYTRKNESHKNGSTAAVEYVIPVEDNDFVTNFYKWYEVGVPGFALPKNLSVKSTNQWTKKTELSWDVDEDWMVVGNNRRSKEGQWVIYRDGEQIGTKTYNTNQMTFTDESVPDYGVNYTYKVAFVPKNMPNGQKNDDLATTLTTSLPRQWSFSDFTATLIDDDAHVKLTWTHSAIEDATGSKPYTLTVHRSDDDGQTWSGAIYTSTISSKGTQEGSYIDNSDELHSNHTYKYEIRITLLDTEFTANTSPITLGGSQLKNFTASRGNYSNVVKLAWTVKQVGGEETSFVVARRPLGTEGNDKGWQTIHTISGTNTSYSYEDNTALLGTYNEYRIAIVDKNNSSKILGSLMTDGFTYSTGIVSGRVKYGTGTAVEGVKIKLKQQSDDGDLQTSGMRSLKLTGSRAGLILKTDRETIQQLFGGDFSVQMYVNPSLSEMNGSVSTYNLLHAIHIFYMSLAKSGDAYKLGAWVNRQTEISNLTIPADKWSHVTLVHNHEAKTTMLYIAAADTLQKALVRNGHQINWEKNGNNDPMTVDSLDIFSIAGLGQNGNNNFRGYVDEFRFFTKALSEKEILRNYNHPLAGNEDGLAIYYPFDEGLTKQTIAYDYSKTNGVANGHHAQTYIPAYSESVKLPSEEQLCMMNYTDSLGNYTIRGIHFQGEGTPYSIIPEYNIHEFSPSAQSRFVSASSLVHSGVDFEDVSSFPVSGMVRYSGTNYPVEGCTFSVDGVTCTRAGNVIQSDANGEFTISVPIGKHFVQVKKNGHTFVNEGRFPPDPNHVDSVRVFNAEITNLEFRDTTLVNFTGRVVGGDIENSQPLGFSRSKNNIGRAKIVLSPLDDRYSMNVEKRVKGSVVSFDFAEQNMAVESAKSNINSVSWRGAGADYSKQVFIRTDSLTGEFSALLPPIEYKIDSLKLVANGFKVGDPSVLDLSNVNQVYSDTLYNDDETYTLYEYHTALKHAYHSTPNFVVQQKGLDEGAFGIKEFEYSDAQGKVKIPIYTVDDNGTVTYNYDKPLFKQYDPYVFQLHGYESYKNADNNVESIVPLAGSTVTISNPLSAEQPVYLNSGTDQNGNEVQAGQVADAKPNELTLDAEGKATYKWQAGLPNVASPYTRSISMTYDVNGQPYQWKKEGFDAIILGDLPTGNNFVTTGPDQLMMILRDPPGTGSSAEWSTGTISATSTLTGDTWSESFEGGTTMHFGLSTMTLAAAGVGVLVGEVVLTDSDDDLTLHAVLESEGENSTTVENSVTITTAVATSEEPDYVGADGDVFVGRATNIIFGNARNVGFKRQGDGFSLDLTDVFTTGVNFGTTFNYTQSYIVNTLIPNYEKMRKEMLIRDGNPVTDAYIKGFTNSTGRAVYLTTKTPDDPDFGAPGTYTGFAPQKALGVNGTSIDFEKVCTDSVKWINTQIDNWEYYLALNEKEKVQAYKLRENKDSVNYVNYSFDGGSSVSHSVEKEKTKTTSYEWNVAAGLLVENEFGFKFSGFGLDVQLSNQVMGGRHEAEESTTGTTSSFSYTLAEEGSDALTVDVYEYGAFGPIFRTRGGQTCNPYEGEVRTSYYEEKNGNHPVIMEATMQIEVPQIDVANNVMTDIPSGSVANYTLHLSNASEIGEDVVYRLFFLDETNPDGAQLSIDGKVLTEEGRLIKVPGNQTLTKTLQLQQTNPSILDYENITIVFASDSQPDEIFNSVDISAHFTPSSSPVKLALSNTTMNTLTGSNLELTLSDFDRNYHNLKAFLIQYKKEGSTGWTQLKKYVINAQDTTNYDKLLPDGASVSYTLPMSSFTDGNYLFRAVSVATYGTGEVYRYSDELALVKDTERPRPMGQPEPTDGIFDIGDELSVTFNEDVLKGQIDKLVNFEITGVLNGADVAHETALSLTSNTGTTATAQTEANINLENKDFSIDTWVNITDAGLLLRHGQGSNKLTVGTDSNGKLVVEIAGETYTSTNAVPKNEWAFLTMNVATDNEGTTRLNATMATANETITLFNSAEVATYQGNGPLAVGCGSTGAMHELLLWDEAHDMTTALLNRSKSKSPSTRHLIGYWKMNEGEGKSIRDYARNRHMTMPNETWYLNNVNKAVALDGKSYLSLFAGDSPYTTADDYAIEFWMRGNKQTGEAQLLQAGKVALWLNSEGVLQMTSNVNEDAAVTLATTSGDLTDNAWHHVALNVLRNGAAAVYVDGERKLTTNSANVGNIATDHILVGVKRTAIDTNGILSYNYDCGFKGDVDEIRVWDATLNANFLNANRKVRLNGKEAGLVAYYPFEYNTVDDSNQPVTLGTPNDFAYNQMGNPTGHQAELLTIDAHASAISYIDEAPALREKPTETNVNFSYVASNEKIIIDIDEDPAAIEGCTLNFIVRNVRDVNGNNSMPAVWSAFVNRKQLVWKDDVVAAEQYLNTGSSVTATLVNKGGQQQMWTLSGMPSWITVASEYGTTNPLAESTITFNIAPAAPLGRHEVTVYATDNDNIAVPLTINVKVTGDVPDWAVNPADFEMSMNVIGQLQILGVQSQNEDDIVAAFVGNKCHGIAHPVYMDRYDGYFVTMDIYGNDTDVNTPLEFKVFEAATGNIYPVVRVTSGSDHSINFDLNDLKGTYRNPVIFNATDEIEQNFDLCKGWNWMSLGVRPDDNSIENIFGKNDGKLIQVKSQTSGYAKYDFDDEDWLVQLTGMTNAEMYMVQALEDVSNPVTGHIVDAKATPITLHKGWNWIGFHRLQTMSLAEALAGWDVQDNDIIKGQRGVAYYDGYEWVGSLRTLVPGQGYMIKNEHLAESGTLTFNYPTSSVKGSGASHIKRYEPKLTFTPVDYHSYPTNMAVCAQVVMDGQPVEGIEVGIFAGKECRQADVTDERGMVYVTVPGNEPVKLTFRVTNGADIYESCESQTYETDAVIGTPKAPLIINLDSATGIRSISNSTSECTYDLSGRKVADSRKENRQLSRGVYIVNGQKIVVK